MLLQTVQVGAFHKKFARAIGKHLGDNFNDEKQRKLRAALILEEACEFVAASGFDPAAMFAEMGNVIALNRVANGDPHLAQVEANFPLAVDAMMDILYVVFGAAVTYGLRAFTVEELFNEVHKANMAKTGGPERADGKILKPEGWKPPDIEGILRRVRWEEDGAGL